MCLVRCSTLLNCQPSSFICVYAMIINNSTLLLQVTDRTTVFCVTRSSLSRRRWRDTWEFTRESGHSAVPSASWGSSARPHWNDILRLTPEISRRWCTAVIWSKSWVATHLGCVKWKLALHGLAAYLMVCSSAAVYKAGVNKDGGC